MTDTLMRRDLPLQKGRILAIRVTTVHMVILDDDLLQDGEREATVEQVERWLAESQDDPGTSKLAYALRRSGYPFDDVEHEVLLDDATVSDEFGPVLSQPRFETRYERVQRIRSEEYRERHGLPAEARVMAAADVTYIPIPEPDSKREGG